jgi:AcrR family transcriptional regulator
LSVGPRQRDENLGHATAGIREYSAITAGIVNPCSFAKTSRKNFTLIFMTLHRASGTDDDDLREAIAAGITVVHINTEVRLAWRRGLDAALAKQPGEIVPYRILPQVVESVKRIVAARLALLAAGRVRVMHSSSDWRIPQMGSTRIVIYSGDFLRTQKWMVSRSIKRPTQ